MTTLIVFNKISLMQTTNRDGGFFKQPAFLTYLIIRRKTFLLVQPKFKYFSMILKISFFPYKGKATTVWIIVIPVTDLFLFHTVKGDERGRRHFHSPWLDAKVSLNMYDQNLFWSTSARNLSFYNRLYKCHVLIFKLSSHFKYMKK